ncbi:hypothetical protein LTS10_002583 [Elasticomyces elasticus]|nr:hypothetical protein LTS10_002583 [Elasticomyces elasticus]
MHISLGISESPEAVLSFATIDIGLQLREGIGPNIVDHQPTSTIRGSPQVKHVSTHATLDPGAGGGGFEGRVGEIGRATEQDESSSWKFQASRRPRADGTYGTMRLQWQAETKRAHESFAGRPLHAAAVLQHVEGTLLAHTTVHAKLMLRNQRLRIWRPFAGSSTTERSFHIPPLVSSTKTLKELQNAVQEEIMKRNQQSVPYRMDDAQSNSTTVASGGSSSVKDVASTDFVEQRGPPPVQTVM